MPNHIHAIIVIGCDGRAERSRPLPTLSEVVGLYKSGMTRCIHAIAPGRTVWQRSFYDRVIRGDREYAAIWQYIEDNPRRWADDELHPHPAPTPVL